MATQFQMMTTQQLLEADDDLVVLKQLLVCVANRCNKMLNGCEDEDMRRECNMILQANASTFDRVNSVLSMLRKNRK